MIHSLQVLADSMHKIDCRRAHECLRVIGLEQLERGALSSGVCLESLILHMHMLHVASAKCLSGYGTKGTYKWVFELAIEQAYTASSPILVMYGKSLICAP